MNRVISWSLVGFAMSLLMAQECEETQYPLPPEGANSYCYFSALGVPPEVAQPKVQFGNREFSSDRRATVRVVRNGGRCTGTVLDKYTVLTSAHCVYKATDDPGSLTVALGGLSTPPYWDVKEVHTHPDWIQHQVDTEEFFEFRKGDVSVLKVGFDREGKLDGLPGPYAEMVDLDRRSGASQCERILCQGWGKNGTGVLGLAEGEFSIFESDEKEFRARGVTGERIGGGDSGGPLYAIMADGSWKLAGVVRASQGNVSKFVKVSYVWPWVVTHM